MRHFHCAVALAAWGVGLVIGPVVDARARESDSSVWVYVGTYTAGTKSEGIYLCRLDLQSGKLDQVATTGSIINPSFLAVHPSHRFLYAVAEVAEAGGKRTGAVSAFALDPKTGRLEHLNDQSSKGAGPCHVAVDRSGRCVLVANYGGGSVAALPIQDGGRLGSSASAIQHQGKSVNPGRQERPHAHSINIDPYNRFAVAADLGIDKVLIYRLDPASAKLEPNDPPFAAVAPGSGPRHFAFHKDGRFGYVINELSSTITTFRFDHETGRLTELQTISTLPADFEGKNTTAEVQVHPSGRFLYGSNRGHDSIAIFAIDMTGRLTVLGHEPTGGKTPRNFGIDPSGRFLLAANQATENVVVFRIDQRTGKLSRTQFSLTIPAPVCVKFVPVTQ